MTFTRTDRDTASNSAVSMRADSGCVVPINAAERIHLFLQDALQSDAHALDLRLTSEVSRLFVTLQAACAAGVRGDRASDVALHRCLALLYDNLLRIPQPGEWPGYSSVVVQAIQARLEQYVVDSLRAQISLPNEELPSEPRAFIRRLKDVVRGHRATEHGFYSRHLRSHADAEDLKHYFIQELTVDGRFDDLVALMQVGTSGGAKLELAQNYWDEMGEGDARGVHTDLFARVISALGITQADIESARTHESRVVGNLSLMLAARRAHFYRAAGYLGVTEYMVPPRMADVLSAWERNDLPHDAVEYHRVHLPIDVRHANGWFTNVVEPAVANDPETRFHVFEGAVWRLETSCWYLDSLLAHAQRRKEKQQ